MHLYTPHPRLGLYAAFRLMFLLLGFTTNVCHADWDIDPLDKTVELDLVFPTPDETYKRMYPFPIVFAFQGMKTAWPHHLEMSWEVGGQGDDNVSWLRPSGLFPRDLPPEVLGDADSLPWTEGESPGGLDTFFFVVGVSNVFNSSATTFDINYDFSFHFNCSINKETGRIEGKYGNMVPASGKVSFRVGDDGLDPEVTLPGDKCATGLSATQVKSSLNSGIGFTEGPPCPILDEENLYPELSPCQVELPEDLQSSVESLMLETARCTTGMWPAETLIEPCNHNMNALEDDEDSGALLGYSLPAMTMGVMIGLVGVCVICVMLF